MVYNNLIPNTSIHKLHGKSVWYARVTDHPHFTIEHEIMDIPVSKMVKHPKKFDFYIGSEFDLTLTTKSVACQLCSLDGDVEIALVKRDDNHYVLLDDNIYLADTKKELKDLVINDLIKLIEFYRVEKDSARVKWFLIVLSEFDIKIYNEYYDKFPEIFI